MEYDVVLANEVNQTGFRILPPCFPTIGKQFFRIGNVSDRRVKPYVQNFSFCSFYGNGDSPIEVAAYGTWLLAHVEPAFALTVYVGTPFFMIFQNPFAQPCLMFVEGKIPMLGFFHYRLAPANGAFRINKICRRE